MGPRTFRNSPWPRSPMKGQGQGPVPLLPLRSPLVTAFWLVSTGRPARLLLPPSDRPPQPAWSSWVLGGHPVTGRRAGPPHPSTPRTAAASGPGRAPGRTTCLRPACHLLTPCLVGEQGTSPRAGPQGLGGTALLPVTFRQSPGLCGVPTRLWPVHERNSVCSRLN